MTNGSESWGAPALALTVADIRTTFDNSLTSSEAPAMLVTLAALIPCTPEAIARAPIELIDRDRSLLRLPDPHGELVEVALGTHSALAVETAIAGRSSGPLVADVHGQAIDGGADTQAYVVELLTTAAKTPPPACWSFRAMRDAIFGEMDEGGVPHHVAMAQAGLGHRHAPGLGRDAMIAQQRFAADWWAYRLGLLPPSSFIVAHAMVIEHSRALNKATIQRGVSE